MRDFNTVCSELIKHLRLSVQRQDGEIWWYEGTLGLMAELLSFAAAGVRPVVLCRDCKYYYKDADGYEMCDNSEGYDHVTEDGFCAWAVKREEG